MKSSSDRLVFVDGLRAVAILLVLMRHYYMGVYQPGLPRWFDAVGLGYVGVHLFLLLSGFCIAWAYVGDRPRPFQVKDFAWRRATRILPAYYVALVIALSVSGFQGWQFISQAVAHATMTHNLFPATVLELNGAFWSVALECQLYLCFPVLLACFNRSGVLRTLLGVACFQAVFRLAVTGLGTNFNDYTFVVPWGVLGRVFEFTVGMALAHYVRTGTHSRLPRWLLSQPALVASICVLVHAARAAKAHLGVTHIVTDLAWSGAFAVSILWAAQPGVAQRLLSWRPLVLVGSASYSIYLVHQFILDTAIRTLLQPFDGDVARVALLPAVLAATVAVCGLFYLVIEKPTIDFFRTPRSTLRSGSAVGYPSHPPAE